MLLTNEQALGAELRAGGQVWIDGRATAGHQGAAVKHNQQIDERSQTAARGQAIMLGALERHALFISAPCPMWSIRRCSTATARGWPSARTWAAAHASTHTPGASCGPTSRPPFLFDPEDYGGGELQVSDTAGLHSVKLKAGDLILHPATDLHQATPVTRGERLITFF